MSLMSLLVDVLPITPTAPPAPDPNLFLELEPTSKIQNRRLSKKTCVLLVKLSFPS